MIPQARPNWDGSTTFRFDYDPGVIATLKQRIPHEYRTWNPDAKSWTMREPFIRVMAAILERRFGDIETVPADPGRHRPPFTVVHGGAGDPDLMTLHLRDDAPAVLIDAAYRCLSKLHHPDTGGDTETMQRLNAAYARLQARQRGQGVA